MRPLQVRRPDAVRPWQHVLEPLAAYLRLAEALWREPALAGAYNFGPLTGEAATVGRVVALARAAYGRGEWAGGEATEGPHEAGWLALEIAKARARARASSRAGRSPRRCSGRCAGTARSPTAPTRGRCAQADIADHEAAA